jgi:deazaflavin-dependent oxidoreductase (nitroreductase family)
MVDTQVMNRINKVIVGLQKVGVVFGPMQVLTVTGRKSGQPRVAPIAIVEVDGGDYLFQAYPKAAWVANVRAAGKGTLKRGRRSREARFTELSVAERAPVLRALVEQHPSTGKRFARNGLADSPSPEAVEAAASRITVFRVE